MSDIGTLLTITCALGIGVGVCATLLAQDIHKRLTMRNLRIAFQREVRRGVWPAVVAEAPHCTWPGCSGREER